MAFLMALAFFTAALAGLIGVGAFRRFALLLPFGLRRREDGVGFSEEVELVFGGDGDVSGECKPERKARQPLVCGAVDDAK